MRISDIPENGESCTLHGRVLAKRVFGKLIFLDLIDETGKIQLSATAGHETFDMVNGRLKLWDIIEGEGDVYYTRTGEKTIALHSCSILTPFQGEGIDKFHGINDYADGRVKQLVSDRTLFQTLRTRAQMMSVVRRFFEDQGFLEAETSILIPEENTSRASSFSTYCNDLDKMLYLRKTPEQQLKKLVAAGFDAIYEIGRDFRNEAISKYFQPEFTVLEAYRAHTTYHDMETLMRGLLARVETLPLPRSIQGYDRIEFTELMNAHDFPQSNAETIMRDLNARVRSRKDVLLVQHFPAWMSSLTLARDGFSEEFRLYVDGELLAHGNSELVDYAEQRERFVEQAKMTNVPYDPSTDTFLEALRIGMPPTGGFGIGIDRLVMHYTSASNIREVIAFPK